MKKIFLLCLIILLQTKSSAQAKIDIGSFKVPGLSSGLYLDDNKVSRFTYGLEFTYTRSYFTGDFSKKIVPSFTLWATAGINRIDKIDASLLYFEFGTWYLLNIGIGKNFTTINNQADSDFYAFLGFPIPLHPAANPWYFFEPYIKLRINEQNTFINNYGILLKVAFGV